MHIYTVYIYIYASIFIYSSYPFMHLSIWVLTRKTYLFILSVVTLHHLWLSEYEGVSLFNCLRSCSSHSPTCTRCWRSCRAASLCTAPILFSSLPNRAELLLQHQWRLPFFWAVVVAGHEWVRLDWPRLRWFRGCWLDLPPFLPFSLSC